VKKCFLLIICVLAISLTGCAKYPLSETETDSVAEYMAGLLLKYNKNYSASLLSYQETDETADTVSEEVEDVSEENEKDINVKDISEEDVEESTAVVSDKSRSVDEEDYVVDGESKNKDIEYTLPEILETPDFDIQYAGYRLAETFPEDESDGVFVIDAKEGYKFLVVEFSVENITDSDKIFDLTSSDVIYRLDIDKETTYKPQSVLLDNNLLFINLNVKAGKKISAILVFEIPKDADMKEIVLNVYNEEKLKTIEIK